MGQTTSKNQGTLTFGHIASNTTMTITTNTSSSDTTNNNSNDENDNDLLLNQPHLYALADLHLSPQLTLPSPPASPTTTNIINVRFTFLDAYNGSMDKSMQEINLSARRLINLSCNIARLNMIRKLDL